MIIDLCGGIAECDDYIKEQEEDSMNYLNMTAFYIDSVEILRQK